MSGEHKLEEEYAGRFRKVLLFAIIISAISAAVSLYALSLSQYPLGFTEAYDILIKHLQGVTYDRATDYDMWLKDICVWDQNVPRILGCIMIGATLAVGGALMQSTVQNPLADPYTTGIASGALFGVSLYIVYGFTLPFGLPEEASMMLSAYVFAMIPTAVIILATVIKKVRITPTSMILAGIGTMYVFSAASSIIRFSADNNAAQSVYEWTVGSVGRVRLDDLPIILAACVILLIFAILYSKTVDALSEGDNIATSLGVNPKRARLICLIVISLCTATVVCYAGTIGFVGLICPHIARAFTGSCSKYLIPVSAIVGMFMLLMCDCAAKQITITGLPVGVITGLVGAPIFIMILIKQRRESF